MAKNKNFKTWQLVLAVYLMFFGVALAIQFNAFTGIPPIVITAISIGFVAFGIGLFAKSLMD
ncbi:MAG TPA: hypothetical protein VI977_05915 [archaeon]|nr:hypothetical protein [archaeon]